MSTDLAAQIPPVREAWPLERLGRPGLDRAPQPVHEAWDAGAAGDEAKEPTEHRLARLAAALGPLRRVLAALAERLIATEGPARFGYARLGDYARERLGLSARQL